MFEAVKILDVAIVLSFIYLNTAQLLGWVVYPSSQVLRRVRREPFPTSNNYASLLFYLTFISLSNSVMKNFRLEK